MLKISSQNKDLFTQGWKARYDGMIEWVPGADTGGGVTSVDAGSMTVSTDFDDYTGRCHQCHTATSCRKNC